LIGIIYALPYLFDGKNEPFHSSGKPMDILTAKQRNNRYKKSDEIENVRKNSLHSVTAPHVNIQNKNPGGFAGI